MSYELEPFGIKTIIVEPGVINTNFHSSMAVSKKSQDPHSLYTSFMKSQENSLNRLIENTSSQYVA